MSVFVELYAFLKERKKLWLVPVITMMFLLGLFVLAAQTSAIAPFIYTMF